MSGLEVPSLSLDNSLGALFTGILGAAILFGITNAQVFLYFHQRQTDSLCLKTLGVARYILGAFWIFIRRIWRLSRGNHYIVPVINWVTLNRPGNTYTRNLRFWYRQGVRAFEEYRRLSHGRRPVDICLEYIVPLEKPDRVETSRCPEHTSNIRSQRRHINKSLFLGYIPDGIFVPFGIGDESHLYFNILQHLTGFPERSSTQADDDTADCRHVSCLRFKTPTVLWPRPPAEAATLAPSQIAINIETVTEQKTDSLSLKHPQKWSTH
ncbi:hypothetical protein GLOTRDRAFT_96493 [Gloeophyllum trabeum ATCC 11539]|uniref:Uncharacterized protein n=1 Tax=Gloeophyllum trabeum (strain ATCC 11539 / FP-39264 / Madison 617) TaxID=670483 RepID=S7PU42_GLOTA|nr:uncharacterized protein GLOTRDRAFT_96493 [Gloeophyllum trabeum ATCC 11539]EPQ51331.1 hypothetical protein GLOTRDRAFT_96493 [Gloeophyllum trabeum ATCC 11539]